MAEPQRKPDYFSEIILGDNVIEASKSNPDIYEITDCDGSPVTGVELPRAVVEALDIEVLSAFVDSIVCGYGRASSAAYTRGVFAGIDKERDHFRDLLGVNQIVQAIRELNQ